MKPRNLGILFLCLFVMLGRCRGTEISNEEYNRLGQRLLTEVKAALVRLSASIPNLKGIEKAEIAGQSVEKAAERVDHSLSFKQNFHPVAVPSGEVLVPDKDGIVFYIGLTERPFKIRIDKFVILRTRRDTQGSENVNFFYSVDTDSPQTSALIVGEIDKVTAATVESLQENKKPRVPPIIPRVVPAATTSATPSAL